MSQRGYRSGKRGQCPKCSDTFAVTGTGTLFGHKCLGRMRYRQMPEAGSVWRGSRRSNPPKAPLVIEAGMTGTSSDPIAIIEAIKASSPSIDFRGGRRDAFECVSCGALLANPIKRPIYCTEFCRALAEAIRYHRRVLSDLRYEHDPLVMSAVRVNLRKLSNGVVVQPNKIPDSVRDEVFARIDGVCAMPDCLNLATELDHIDGRGGGDVAENLQGLCNGCHLRISESVDKPLSPEMIAERHQVIESGLLDHFWEDYAFRALSESPLAACDDHLRWPSEWAGVARKRREMWKQLTNCVYCGELTEPDDLSPESICIPCEREHILEFS